MYCAQKHGARKPKHEVELYDRLHDVMKVQFMYSATPCQALCNLLVLVPLLVCHVLAGTK